MQYGIDDWRKHSNLLPPLFPLHWAGGERAKNDGVVEAGEFLSLGAGFGGLLHTQSNGPIPSIQAPRSPASHEGSLEEAAGHRRWDRSWGGTGILDLEIRPFLCSIQNS